MWFNPFIDSNSGGGGGGGSSEKVRYSIDQQTDLTTGEKIYKLMQSINDGEEVEVGDIIGYSGSDILVEYDGNLTILNTVIDNIETLLEKTYNFTTFSELNIDTHNKTLVQITNELIAKNLPTNTVVSGQIYTQALPFSGNGEAEVIVNSPAYWWKCGSLTNAPYSWNAITSSSTWGDNGLVMDWTPANYTLPVASDQVLGGVKIGDRISVTNDGTISAYDSFGKGTVLKNADVDLMTDTGIFYVSSDYLSSIVHLPEDTIGRLEIKLVSGANRFIQTYYPFGDNYNYYWMRYYTVNGWTQWYKYADNTGAYGRGVEIPANSDLHDYTKSGCYYCTDLTNIANKPSDVNSAFKLVVEDLTTNDGTRVKHTLSVVGSSDGVMYYEYLSLTSTTYPDGWRPWVRSYPEFEVENVAPESGSTKLLTSGAAYSAYNDKVDIDDVFGVGTTIPDNTDLDTITTIGVYNIQSGAVGLTHYPGDSTGGKLEVKTGRDSVRLRQYFYPDMSTLNIAFYYRQKGATQWTAWKPVKPTLQEPLKSTNDTTNRTTEIVNELTNNGICYLGSGNFYITGIDMPANTEIIGQGNTTKIILDSSVASGYAIKMNTNCIVKDLTIDGGSNTISSAVGTRNGITWLGTTVTNTSPMNGKIENCNILNFSGYGISCKNTSQGTVNFISANTIYIENCNAGIGTEDSEFNKFTAVRTYNCYYGCLNQGGNNTFVQCDFSKCTTGFVINNENLTYSNNGHGSAISCIFNHMDNNTGTAIIVNRTGHGFTFSGCQIFFGNIEITNAQGIIFEGCIFGQDININIQQNISGYSNARVLFSDCSFKTIPITHTTKNTMFKNCSVRSSGGELIDSDVVNRNKFTTASDTFTAKLKHYPIVLPAGTYYVYFGTLTSNDTDATTCGIGFVDSNGYYVSNSGNVAQIDRGNSVYIKLTTTAECNRLRVLSSDTQAHGDGDTASFSNAMVLTEADWAASQNYTPYCPDNTELQERLSKWEGITIQSGDNINDDMKEQGIYKSNNGTITNSLLPSGACPISGAGFVMEVYYNNTNVIQVLHPNSASMFTRTYQRAYVGGSWTPWSEFISGAIMTQQEYDNLQTKTDPLYYIYEV